MEYKRKIGMRTMEKNDELNFNCAEDVLMQVNKVNLIPAFNESCMKIASVFGGGIGGSGKVCGAVSSAAMALGLALGTTGTETLDEFKTKRKYSNEIVKEFIVKFTEAWGTVCCEHLKAMDEGKEKKVGTQRRNQKAEQKMCEDYVIWASDMVKSILKE